MIWLVNNVITRWDIAILKRVTCKLCIYSCWFLTSSEIPELIGCSLVFEAMIWIVENLDSMPKSKF